MTKWILMLMLVMIRYSAIAKEEGRLLLDWECETLFHIANGNNHLVAQEPWNALEEFDKAKSILDKAGNLHPPINFLISFGQVIAYDYLGCHEQCRASIGSLFITINESDDEEVIEGDVFSDEKNENSKVAISFLKTLAILSPSAQVRELLLSLIEDMANQLLPAFEFADSSFLEYGTFEFDKDQDQFSVNQCKSLWKRVRKWTKECAEWVVDLFKVCKGVNDLKKAYKEWKKEDDHDLSYEEFKRYNNQNINRLLQKY